MSTSGHAEVAVTFVLMWLSDQKDIVMPVEHLYFLENLSISSISHFLEEQLFGALSSLRVGLTTCVERGLKPRIASDPNPLSKSG